MRVQFVKAAPATVVRGEWFSVELRIVNESNGSVKITSKVAFLFRLRLCSLNSQNISQISASVSLVSHIGAPCEGASILDATAESPSLFTECAWSIRSSLIACCSRSNNVPCSQEKAVEQVCSASLGLPQALVARSNAMQRLALHVSYLHSLCAVAWNSKHK